MTKIKGDTGNLALSSVKTSATRQIQRRGTSCSAYSPSAEGSGAHCPPSLGSSSPQKPGGGEKIFLDYLSNRHPQVSDKVRGCKTGKKLLTGFTHQKGREKICHLKFSKVNGLSKESQGPTDRRMLSWSVHEQYLHTQHAGQYARHYIAFLSLFCKGREEYKINDHTVPWKIHCAVESEEEAGH